MSSAQCGRRRSLPSKRSAPRSTCCSPAHPRRTAPSFLPPHAGSRPMAASPGADGPGGWIRRARWDPGAGRRGAAVVRPWSGASRASVGAPTRSAEIRGWSEPPPADLPPPRRQAASGGAPRRRQGRRPRPPSGTSPQAGATSDRAPGAYPPGTAAFVTAVRDTAMKKAVARRADPVPRQRRAGPSGPANRVPTRSRVCRERERRGPPWAFCLSAARAHRAQPSRCCRAPSCARRSRPC